MKVVEVLHMNRGIGDNSYANNSVLQKRAILRAKPITDESIRSLYTSLNPKTISIADLGCSSGPNSFLAISNLIKAVHNHRKNLGRLHSPEFQIYLNDLPTNDFNTLFRSLPKLQEDFRKVMGDGLGLCFFNGVSGSFYGRLFPTDTLHFVHSSYSVHWLSQVPKGIEENKGNICMAPTSPLSVKKAYCDQFHNDFSMFLKSRSEELVKDGRMVLTVRGRKNEKPAFRDIELLAMALKDLAAEGFVEEEKINSFNVPIHTPSVAEVKSLVEKDGAFTIHCLEAYQIHWSEYEYEYDNDDNIIGNKNDAAYGFARCIRAVFEPILVSHFGEGMIEEVFHRYTNIVANTMSREKTEFTNVIVSLIKK